MKKKELNDLKQKEVKDLKALVSKKKLELIESSVKIAKNAQKNVKFNWKVKKEIAQIMSIIRVKELETN
jgi:ribosomal protein L29